jgi:hypothetical protein
MSGFAAAIVAVVALTKGFDRRELPGAPTRPLASTPATVLVAEEGSTSMM